MKTKIIAGALALSLMGGAAAQAQSYGYYGHSGSQYGSQYGNQYGGQYDRYERRADRRAERQAQRRWARGQYMPAQYRTRAYVVNDYRRYGYAAPPRGYHYVRSGNDVVLAVIATGLIAMVLSGSMR